MIPALADTSPRAERPTERTSSPTRAGARAASLRRFVRACFHAQHSKIGSSIATRQRSVKWFSLVRYLERVGAAESMTHRHDDSWPPQTPLEVERPPPCTVTMLSCTASIVSAICLESALQTA